METLEYARAAGGIITITALVSLLVLDFWFTSRVLNVQTVIVLLTLISALLGVDIATDKLGIKITKNNDNKNE
jgi:hypothetical protein